MKKNNSIMEVYRILRNTIDREINSDIKSLSITSNSDIEGKTIIAKNFAVMLAKSSKNTLFIDCNLSNMPGENGLLSILQVIENSYINDIELKNYIMDTQCANLSVLKLGSNNIDDYGSGFKTENLKYIIERLKKYFDYIIIDAPSFKNLSYTQILVSATDGCLFVLKEGINDVSEGIAIREKLSNIGCRVLGCVLNKEKKSTEIFGEEYSSFFNRNNQNKRSKILKGINTMAKA